MLVTLFTNVPPTLAVQVIRERMESDYNLEDRTALSTHNICLFELCLETSYFSFRGNYYQQLFDTAMSIPISVILANMVMEYMVQTALYNFEPFRNDMMTPALHYQQQLSKFFFLSFVYSDKLDDIIIICTEIFPLE